MFFDAGADAYARFMGRFADPLSVAFADTLPLGPGVHVLDVGAGSGSLTQVLVARVGAEHVAAVEPSPPFVDSLRARLPGVDVRAGVAESLPFDDDTFDVVVAQLVVHFMSDAVAGLAEMRRVCRPGGLVAASVWDYGGERSPLSLFWSAAAQLDVDVTDESGLAGARDGHLVDLFHEAGFADVVAGELTVSSSYADVDDWWSTYELGVGPAGAYVASLNDDARTALRERCRAIIGDQRPVVIDATAWTAAASA